MTSKTKNKLDTMIDICLKQRFSDIKSTQTIKLSTKDIKAVYGAKKEEKREHE